MKTLKKLAFILAVLCLPCQCAAYSPICEKDSRQIEYAEIFNHRWWNYYDRAIFFGNKGCFEEAIKDFEAAIREESEKEDQWMARIYGIDFMDYFPRRELGIIQYRQKDWGSAIEKLETSLGLDIDNEGFQIFYPEKGTETDRAKIYLDMARNKSVKFDETPPLIKDVFIRRTSNLKELNEKFGLDQNSPIINDFSVVLSGIAEDEDFVRHITIRVIREKDAKVLFQNDVPVSVSAKKIPFMMTIPLGHGENKIVIKAVNLAGYFSQEAVHLYDKYQTEKIYAVHVDREGPTIGPDDSGDIYALDDSKLAKIILDNKKFLSDDLNAEGLLRKFRPESREETTVKTTVEDNVGNMTEAKIDIYAMIRDITKRSGVLWAENTANGSGLSDVSGFPEPVIEIENQVYEWYDRHFKVEGSVFSVTPLKSISVSNVLINEKQLPEKPRNICYFTHRVRLRPGSNLIRIVAKAKGFEPVKKAFDVRYRVPKAEKIESRLKLAVCDFERKEMAGDTFVENFEKKLVDVMISDFWAGEFYPEERIKKLYDAIRSDAYDLPLETGLDMIAWLNEMLRVPDLYKKVMGKKPGFQFSEPVMELVRKTKVYRDISYSELNDASQNAIRKLNRLIFEELYPNKTPRHTQRFQAACLSSGHKEDDEKDLMRQAKAKGFDALLSGDIEKREDNSVHIKFWMRDTETGKLMLGNDIMDIYGNDSIPGRNAASLPGWMSLRLAHELPLVRGEVVDMLKWRKITVKVDDEDAYQIEKLKKRRMGFVVYERPKYVDGILTGENRILGYARYVKTDKAKLVMKTDKTLKYLPKKGDYYVIAR